MPVFVSACQLLDGVMEPGPPSPPPSFKIDLFYYLVRIFIFKINGRGDEGIRGSELPVHLFVYCLCKLTGALSGNQYVT